MSLQPATSPDPALAGPPADAVEPFAPPSDAWRRVSPKLATVRRITTSIWVPLVFGVPGAVALAFLPEDLRWIPLVWIGLGVALWVWLLIRAGRFVARIGWARRDEDLCLVEGLMWRTLTVVPFGRMQVVRVTSGPLLRAFGLATVELVTASAATDMTIPGLPADEARELRDLIIELSDAQGSGL